MPIAERQPFGAAFLFVERVTGGTSLSRSKFSIAEVVLVALFMVASACAAHAPVPDLSGTWTFDPIKSTEIPPFKNDTLKIERIGEQLTFNFIAHGETVATIAYTADGKQRPEYKTRQVRAYGSAKFEKGALVVTTKSYIDAEGTQTYTETDRWSLADDGKTLIDKMSDSKTVIYHKVEKHKE